VLHFELTASTDLPTAFPQAEVIVGADGAHSLCRRLFFGEASPGFYETLHSTLLLKYEVSGKTRPLRKLLECYPTLKLLGSVLIEEPIGRHNAENDRTPVTLQMIIEAKDFMLLKSPGLRSVMTFDEFALVPDALQTAIKVWVNVRHRQCGDLPVHLSEKINAIPLVNYRITQVAKLDQDRAVFLVGGACFAVPYFRALNNGLLCGSSLAATLAAMLNGAISKSAAVTSYSQYIAQLSTAEFSKAKAKRGGLRFVNWFAQFNFLILWQFIRWSSANIIKFKAEVLEFCRR
jgi:2-polyprenyl-6-methoxyphenol hydroxylase-like FAD-dependent oxidoreductase